MSDFWLKLAGFDTTRIPDGADTEWVWTHAPASWGIFVWLAVAAVVVLAAWRLYAGEMSSCPPRLKRVLAAFRIATLALLAVIFIGPALGISIKRTIQPYVLLLLDDSLSMGIHDAYEPETAKKTAETTGVAIAEDPTAAPARIDLVDGLLRKDNGRFVEELRQHGRLRVMSFSDRLRVRESLDKIAEPSPAEKPLERGEPVPPIAAEGPATDISKAVRESIASVGGNPIAGIVLVTDGQNTSGADPAAAADFAASQRVPIFAVGVGETKPAPNLRVADVWAPETAFAGDPLLVQARLQAEGVGQRTVAVEFVEKKSGADEAGKETVLERRDVALRDNEPVDLTFKHLPKTAGQFAFIVRVAPLPGESITSDNERTVAVRVVSEQAKVLLIAGGPSWDFQAVRTLLIRDKTIDVSCWLQSIDPDMRQDGDTIIERLPEKPEDLFKYDVVFLFDPDPTDFSENWCENLRRFVGEHSGGLLWMSGPKYAVRFLTGPRTRDIRDLLPVRLGDFSGNDIRAISDPQMRPWRFRVTPAGSDHPITTFDKDPQINARLWEAMPPFFWSFPCGNAKPGSAVLLEHSDPQLKVKDQARPLLVAGQYGSGRSLYLGFNSTWRWAKLGEKYFDQFWIQSVRYLLEGRVLGGKKRGRLATDRDTYPLGTRVVVNASLFTPTFEPLSLPSVDALVRGRPGTAPANVELRPIANRPGQYEGSFVASQLGINEIEISLPAAGQATQPVRLNRQVQIEAPRVEFADPRLNRALLLDMAERSGGTYVPLADIFQIVEKIPDRRETVVVRETPKPLWDTSRVLFLLVALLTVEWAIRKRYQLL